MSSKDFKPLRLVAPPGTEALLPYATREFVKYDDLYRKGLGMSLWAKKVNLPDGTILRMTSFEVLNKIEIIPARLGPGKPPVRRQPEEAVSGRFAYEAYAIEGTSPNWMWTRYYVLADDSLTPTGVVLLPNQLTLLPVGSAPTWNTTGNTIVNVYDLPYTSKPGGHGRMGYQRINSTLAPANPAGFPLALELDDWEYSDWTGTDSQTYVEFLHYGEGRWFSGPIYPSSASGRTIMVWGHIVTQRSPNFLGSFGYPGPRDYALCPLWTGWHIDYEWHLWTNNGDTVLSRYSGATQLSDYSGMTVNVPYPADFPAMYLLAVYTDGVCIVAYSKNNSGLSGPYPDSYYFYGGPAPGTNFNMMKKFDALQDPAKYGMFDLGGGLLGDGQLYHVSVP